MSALTTTLAASPLATTTVSVGGTNLLARRPTMPEADRRQYGLFRERFIASDGRVVDNYNGGVSHSEGQGWGMLMAASFDDRETFDRIHQWTRRSLRRGNDNLHSWRYQPNARIPVSDPNNATDGDLYIAGALARAGRWWGRPELSEEATAIGRDMLHLLVRKAGDRVVLMPGLQGFEQSGSLVVNLSYYSFAMMQELRGLVPTGSWKELERDGLRMIEEARFGSWGLPPDWLQVEQATGRLSPAPNRPARFSYDAIRIPLNLAWCGLSSPGLNQAFDRYWNGPHPHAPAWVDLTTNLIAPYPAESGTRAVARTALGSTYSRPGTSSVDPSLGISPSDNYYSAALVVLSRIATYDYEARPQAA